jgi:hypothetical protein
MQEKFVVVGSMSHGTPLNWFFITVEVLYGKRQEKGKVCERK